jgi:hypothetical protein
MLPLQVPLTFLQSIVRQHLHLHACIACLWVTVSIPTDSPEAFNWGNQSSHTNRQQAVVTETLQLYRALYSNSIVSQQHLHLHACIACLWVTVFSPTDSPEASNWGNQSSHTSRHQQVVTKALQAYGRNMQQQHLWTSSAFTH